MLLEAPNPRCQVQTHQSFPGGRAGSNSASKCFKKDQWTRSLFWRGIASGHHRTVSGIYLRSIHELDSPWVEWNWELNRLFFDSSGPCPWDPREGQDVQLPLWSSIQHLQLDWYTSQETGNAFRINCSFVNNRLKPSVPNDTLITQLWQEEGIIWQSRTWGHWIRLPSRHQLNLGTATSLWNHLIRGKLVIQTRSLLSVKVDELHSPGSRGLFGLFEQGDMKSNLHRSICFHLRC